MPFTAWNSHTAGLGSEMGWGRSTVQLWTFWILKGFGSIRQTHPENSGVRLPPLPAERSEWEVGV